MSSQAARIVLTIVFALAVCLLRVQSKDCESCADVPTQKQCGMITLMCGTTVKCVFANDCQMLQRKCLFGETWKKMDTVECKRTSPKCVQFGLLS